VIASLSQFFVFIHIPKNAGTSVHDGIKDAFRNDRGLVAGWGVEDGCDLAHPLPATIKRRFPEVYETLQYPRTKSFAILRDPVSRIISAFNEHRAQYGGHPDACGDLGSYLDAIEARTYAGEDASSHMFIHGAPQSAFLFEESRSLVKTLFRMDDPLAMVRISLLLGRPLPVSPGNHRNSSTISYLDRETLGRITRIFEQDYDLIDAVPLSGATLQP
jgi:hypothetical protein